MPPRSRNLKKNERRFGEDVDISEERSSMNSSGSDKSHEKDKGKMGRKSREVYGLGDDETVRGLSENRNDVEWKENTPFKSRTSSLGEPILLGQALKGAVPDRVCVAAVKGISQSNTFKVFIDEKNRALLEHGWQWIEKQDGLWVNGTGPNKHRAYALRYSFSLFIIVDWMPKHDQTEEKALFRRFDGKNFLKGMTAELGVVLSEKGTQVKGFVPETNMIEWHEYEVAAMASKEGSVITENIIEDHFDGLQIGAQDEIVSGGDVVGGSKPIGKASASRKAKAAAGVKKVSKYKDIPDRDIWDDM